MSTKRKIGGQYQPLSADQIEKIHETALSILEQVGFTYEACLDETMDLMALNGAIIKR